MTLETDRSWPRNTWYLAAWSSELHDGPLARTVLNEHIVLYRDQNGTIAALEDRCCHCAAPLSMGRIVPKGLQCGYHGLTFGGDGKCVSIPGQDSIPPQARVKSYPVVARGEFVWIWMGNPEIADPQQLARFPPYDENKRGTHMHGMVPIKCNYMLLVDNLMDLTHILFVHRSSIGGGGEMELVNADVDVKRTELGLRYIRWMLGHTPPPIYITALCLGDGAKVDRWQEFEYVAPGSVLQWTGGMEVGRGARENREQNGSLSVRLYHGVTPETENSCFYFGCEPILKMTIPRQLRRITSSLSR